MTVDDLAEALGSAVDLREESTQVRASLAALGRLLGAALIEPPRTLSTFVETYLGLPAHEISGVTTPLPGVQAPLVHVAVGRLIDAAPGAVLADDGGRYAPGFDLVTVDVDEQVAAPDDLAAYLPAGAAFAFPAVLVLTQPAQVPMIELRVGRSDLDAAREVLARLVSEACGAQNFYRGRTLRVEADQWKLDLVPVRAAGSSRTDVVHDEAVWAEIDANVGGLVAHGEALVAAGLGASRGILLAGPPGVGKTALCRVIASELPAGTTVLVVDPAVDAAGLARIYDAVADLAPAAVFLDDIDLMAGDRRTGRGGPNLGEFLAKLDGFTPQASVITVATTNAAESLDPALIRPGRFDAVIEIGPPSRAARTEILSRLLAPITSEVDVDPVVARTDGCSGADLREIVRRAVLERGTDVTTQTLLEVIATGRWRPKAPTGQYL